MKFTDIKTLLNKIKIGSKVNIKGWIRTCRDSKNVIFISLNDGSTISNLQIVFIPSLIDEEIKKELNTGACIEVIGTIEKSQGKNQNIELVGKEIKIIGKASAEEYPLQPKRHSLEFLRSISHLRFRTNAFSAIFRVRNCLSFAIHKFFNENGFIYLNTPIITSCDAEGAGEMFTVTSADLTKISKDYDYKQDFFGKKVNLTVSGQLAGETGAMALGKIYTFGPTFRAENSNTSRHLAEFWMVEPEIAFYELNDNIDLAEEFLKYIIEYVLKNSQDDLKFLDKRYSDIQKSKPQNERDDKSLIEKLEYIVKTRFQRITYTEAFDILRNCSKNKKKKFEYLVKDWGIDLQSEHERYLTEKHFKKPVVVTDYPKDIKAFYMYKNEDDKTVAAMDILVPGIGEIIGGAQREHRYDILKDSMDKFNVDKNQLSWYLDTRKFGTAPHSGFGLGLERMIQLITGMDNIRDVIAFPRTPGKAEC
ncbi:MAG: asparagine--tRNA ligase [Bacteroidetes bacterium]|nr:asparagine--tRNA ligase [Bacteroidota bacterium]